MISHGVEISIARGVEEMVRENKVNVHILLIYVCNNAI